MIAEQELDRSEIESLVHEHRLQRYLHYLGCPRDDIADLVQETFVRLLRGVLRQNPDWVSMRELMTLAGRNQPAAITRIEALVKARPDDITLVPYASVLALHGNRAGRKILRAYLANAPQIGVDDRTFMAAIGLHALGDAEAWSKQVERVKASVDKAPSEDNFRLAQVFVLRAAYYRKAVATGKPIPLAGVLDPARLYYAANVDG